MALSCFLRGARAHIQNFTVIYIQYIPIQQAPIILYAAAQTVVMEVELNTVYHNIVPIIIIIIRSVCLSAGERRVGGIRFG